MASTAERSDNNLEGCQAASLTYERALLIYQAFDCGVLLQLRNGGIKLADVGANPRIVA